MIDQAQKILQETFGFSRFRPGQQEIIETVLGGHDVLAVMPTGSGKSLCYQLPALLSDGVSLVISPLIALMRDQVAALRMNGIGAGALNSSIDPQERNYIYDSIHDGSLKLLYVAPERLVRTELLDFLKGKVNRLVIDEAHCVSQWGHDFRPEYLEIGMCRKALGDIQVMGLTATADETTQADIINKLFPAPPKSFIHGFDRPNLSLSMRPKNNPKRQILDFVQKHDGASGIVYCLSRNGTEKVAKQLLDAGIRALPYHAGLAKHVRDEHQDIFLREDGVVIAATVAFGMGIDKPDVRFVCHADLPSSIEAYYQEIGRAGRDNLPADTLTLYGMQDIVLRRRQIEEGDSPPERKRIELQRLNALLSLCEAASCRRQMLLTYFGESSDPCGNCDICLGEVEVIEGTIPAQKAMSAILRTGERFGTEHLVSILKGEITENIARWNHDKLKTFGIGDEMTKNEWRALFRQLYAAGHIHLDMVNYGRWQVTPTGWDILKSKSDFMMRKDILKPKQAAISTPKSAPPIDISEADQETLIRLKTLRRAIADAQNVPAYVIFADRTLIELAAKCPRSLAEMEGIYGIGKMKLEKYGQQFLDEIGS